MANIKGKFITLSGHLLGGNQEVIAKANNFLENEIGLTHLELDPEEFYDVKLFSEFLEICFNNNGMKENGYVILGKRVYPTIKRTTGLPPHLNSTLDFILFEAEGFLANHEGEGVVPRTFLKKENGLVEIVAKAPGYNSKLYEGVFLGILEMCGETNGKVNIIDVDTFKITW